LFSFQHLNRSMALEKVMRKVTNVTCPDHNDGQGFAGVGAWFLWARCPSAAKAARRCARGWHEWNSCPSRDGWWRECRHEWWLRSPTLCQNGFLVRVSLRDSFREYDR